MPRWNKVRTGGAGQPLDSCWNCRLSTRERSLASYVAVVGGEGGPRQPVDRLGHRDAVESGIGHLGGELLEASPASAGKNASRVGKCQYGWPADASCGAAALFARPERADERGQRG